MCLHPSANLSEGNGTHIWKRDLFWAVPNSFRAETWRNSGKLLHNTSLLFASSFISFNCDHKLSCETWRNMLLAKRLLLNGSHAFSNPTINPIAPGAARQSPAGKLNNILAVVYQTTPFWSQHSNSKLKKSFQSDCLNLFIDCLKLIYVVDAKMTADSLRRWFVAKPRQLRRQLKSTNMTLGHSANLSCLTVSSTTLLITISLFLLFFLVLTLSSFVYVFKLP